MLKKYNVTNRVSVEDSLNITNIVTFYITVVPCTTKIILRKSCKKWNDRHFPIKIGKFYNTCNKNGIMNENIFGNCLTVII